MRTGAFSYVLIGGLALALLAVIALALTSKQVSDRKTRCTDLRCRSSRPRPRRRACRRSPTSERCSRAAPTPITSLAQSRFDWQRVLNELARVIPSNVWLVQLAGTVDPTVTVDGLPRTFQTRASIPGPALEIVGCATSQDAVAGLVSNLEEIDGVTRVGVESSLKPSAADASGASGSTPTSGAGQTSTTECRTRNFIAKFQIVVAFDAVPTPATATASPSVPSNLAGSGSQLASQTSSTASSGG